MYNYKTMIIPIVGVLAMGAQLIFGVQIDNGLQNDISDVVANLIAVGAVVYGIFKNHNTLGTS
jgi:hypothetical protein